MQDKRNIENVVQEIMGLVIEHGELCCENNELGHNYRERKIESKLRNLAENSFYVREPLRDEVIKMIDDSTHFHESPDWSIRFARAIERAHNIIKDS